MISALIIDDEYPARAALKQELVLHCPSVNLIGEADGFMTGMKLIDTLKPELIFLDIHLGDGNAFRLLQEVKWKNARIIFTTAFEKYAIRALRLSAIDYLLKPVQGEDIVTAIDKITKENLGQKQTLLMDVLFHNNTSVQDKKIAFTTSEGISLHLVRDIIYCNAESNYCTIHFTGGKKLLTAKPLKDIEDTLEGFGFARVHQSYLVNLAHVIRYQAKNNGELILSNATIVPLSQRKKTQILSLLNQVYNNDVG